MGGGRVGVVLVEGGLEPTGQVTIHGEPIPGQVDGRSGHLPEGHGAELRRRRDPRIGGGRRQGRERAGGHLTPVVLVEVLNRRGLGPDAKPVNGDHLVAVSQVDDGGRHAQEAAIVGVHDIQRQANGHSGVDGVAALLQDSSPAMAALG